MIQVHLKQGGNVTVDSAKKGEWRIKYHGSVQMVEVSESMHANQTKYISIPIENVLFIKEIV